MLFRLFRTMLPQDVRFIPLLCRHSELVAEGAGHFVAMLEPEAPEGLFALLCRAEETADDVTREIVQGIHRSFITPFDRSQILELTTALDDTIDLMKETARRIRLYGIVFTPEMTVMAGCARRATTEIRDAMPFLADIPRNVETLNRMQRQVREAEAEADKMLARGVQRLFASELSAGEKLIQEKVYDLIELVVDRCEDVADVLEGIVVEQV